MEFQLLWFILIAVLWTGYLILEGFDFGVGMLLPILGREEKERRVMINTIGPVWDGNEVWLLTAGGATFAAFPEWYATLFSGFYIPLFIILLCLIARGVAFEYRSKVDDPKWRARWDWAITIGSWLPSILWGVAFANLVRGVELDEARTFTGGFFSLLSPFALLGGVTTLVLFLLHGAIFLSLKTEGDIQVRAHKLSATFSFAAVVVAGSWAIWAQLAYSRNTWTWGAVAVAAVALLAVVFMVNKGREGWAFICSALAMVAAVVLIFGAMFPNVMPASNNDLYSLTIDNARSTDYTLKVMTWVAVILTPIVLLYQSWSFWVFRKRIGTHHIPDPIGVESLSVPSESVSKP